MRRSARTGGLVLASVLLVLLASACSSEPASVPAPAAEPSQNPAQAPRPTSNITVSDAVPTLEYLQDIGLGKRAAECFIATIDPDGTGRVANEELFMEAWVACL